MTDQQTELRPGPLHDAAGHLAQVGWARNECLQYRQGAVTAPWYRLKEWDYYCVMGEEYGVSFVIADNGYMGLLSVTWLDFKNQNTVADIRVLPFPRGCMGMPESADSGDIAVTYKGMTLDFRHVPGGRRLMLDCPSFDGGKGLSGELQLAQPEMDRMVIATPFEHNPSAFYYNQKINCMPATGKVSVGTEQFDFSPNKQFGVLDWGRGVWAYDNQWYWGSASGLVDGRPFGFNIGYGFGDTSAASENMFFLEGHAHKLDKVTFHIPEDGYDTSPWRFSSNDGRFELTFEPVLDRIEDVNILVFKSIVHQVFGRFSGTVVLDNGEKLQITDLMGFAEDVRNRW
jgi:Domain of unknown function (DUF2804), N-terminal/Domain of unknown function (DUF2804), C-terminal